jgi:hypothetical protein
MKPPCIGRNGTNGGTRALILAVHAAHVARGFPDSASALASHRLRICVSASDCGRICPRLIKGPGVAEVRCADISTGTQIPLYSALENPDFECPERRF